MRLIRAELLKMRRRQATWVVLIVAIVLLIVTFLLSGAAIGGLGDAITFPAAYSLIGQFAFGIGGLLAVVYSAAIVGADWNWAVLRNVIARGESRPRYLLAKAAALAIALAIAMLVIFAVGIVMTFVTGWLYGVPVSSPFRGRGLQDLVEWLVLGYPVLIQRAALGFAVAVLLRSQLAGAVIGIVFYVGEAIITTTMTIATFASRFGDAFDPDDGGSLFEPIGPEWFQFLPISMGGNVLNAAPGAGPGTSGGIEQFFLRPVALEIALAGLAIYLVVSLAIAIIALQRQEIV